MCMIDVHRSAVSHSTVLIDNVPESADGVFLPSAADSLIENVLAVVTYE